MEQAISIESTSLLAPATQLPSESSQEIEKLHALTEQLAQQNQELRKGKEVPHIQQRGYRHQNTRKTH